MSISKLKVLGKLQVLDGTTVVQSRDLAESWAIGETVSGQIQLPKGGTVAKLQVALPHLTNPRLLMVQCDCTFELELPWNGTTVVTCDKMALIGLPTYSGLATFGITMITDVTHLPLVYSCGAVG